MLALLVLGLAFGQSGAEIFTAMADMENLLGAEHHVTSVIDKYIEYEQDRLVKLRNFAQEYQKRNEDALKVGADFVSNPVNAYLLIKRLTSDWSFVESMMKKNLADDFLANITSKRAGVRFPDEEDLKGAADALLRLQDTYRLSTADIADGRIQGVKRAEELAAHDCFELGRVAYNTQDYYHTVLWMHEALERMKIEEEPTVQEEDILEYLAFGLYQQGNVKRALALTQRLVEIAPHHPRAQGNVDYYKGELGAESATRDKGDLSDLPPEVNPRPGDAGIPEREMYEALCRGEVPVSPKTLAKYYCYYKRDKPFLWLAPIKVEIVYLDPLAVKFVDAVSDAEGDAIKALATPKLEAPDAGGATVFPELRLTVFPTKNDCVFWYNLLKDGEGDMRTRHAACPVLSGQKWVANKWIHERGQEWMRPCGKTSKENEKIVGDEVLGAYPFRSP